jgi:CBS domain-containing protein
METVRDAMSRDVRFVASDATIAEAAQAMADADVGALPVSDEEKQLCGIITDRDIAVRIVAPGLDPNRSRVRDIVGDNGVITVQADDRIEAAVATMKRHAVRRVPVVDGDRVVGMLSQGDVADQADTEEVGEMVRTISRAPGNTGDGP